MKRIIILLWLGILCLTTKAQDSLGFFNNVNSELCYHLYERSDALGKFRVFLVISDMTEDDMLLLKHWSELTEHQKTVVVQHWALTGKRTECERAPYITYPPRFPHDYPMPTLKRPVLPESDHDPWKEGQKELWFERQEHLGHTIDD